MYHEVNEVNNKLCDVEWLVVGDLNARTGTLDDIFVENNVNKFFPNYENGDCVFNEINCRRNSRDPLFTNTYGTQLTTFCRQNNLCLANGRTCGDEVGNITCIANRGRTIVDYLVLSAQLFQSLVMFTVDPRPKSDHFPLHGKFITMCQNDSDEETIDRHFPLHPFHKVPWNDTRKEEYTVRLENLLENVNRDFNFYLNFEDVDSANDILIDCVKQATQFREQLPYQSSFFSKSTKTQPIWWDEECETLKFTKYRLLRYFHRSNDPLILNQYLEAKQTFKSTCLKKKEEVDRTNIEDLNTAMRKTTLKISRVK
ncbi:RNA-directed DNA polymerase from mobile element jockey [Elysia marginata]|uniref:RNA-directed DNA polymerase from mobile element jockey n=1 Tax=Elysia marginata TaxID=1093978 RepID=A0AAV4HUV9_9GAST|nr:RNA-directed DNA polymerase from mobile element jockey [Elysia marginata]